MRRVLAIALFATLALGVLFGGHFYLTTRLVLEPNLAEPLRSLLLAGIGLLGASLFAAPIAERTLRPRAARWIAWPAALWMGFAFLLLVLLAASDLALWLLDTAASAAPTAGLEVDTAARGRALAVVGLAGTLGGVALRSALRGPRVKRVTLGLERWPRGLDGFRIVQLSDIHIGPILRREFAGWLVERANALEPDLVAITGDLVDGSVASLRDEVEPFSELRAPHGSYFVTGNHDYFSGADPWVERVRELGIRVLRNERVQIGEADASFDLAGVEDHRASFVTGGPGEDLEAALQGRDPTRPLVLLAHDPSTFKRASKLGVDLQLSGHTHGGQIWPFVYLVRLAVPFVAGLYRVGAAQLYVSRGSGFWGPPLRLGAPAEITEITLHCLAAEGMRTAEPRP